MLRLPARDGGAVKTRFYFVREPPELGGSRPRSPILIASTSFARACELARETVRRLYVDTDPVWPRVIDGDVEIPESFARGDPHPANKADHVAFLERLRSELRLDLAVVESQLDAEQRRSKRITAVLREPNGATRYITVGWPAPEILHTPRHSVTPFHKIPPGHLAGVQLEIDTYRIEGHDRDRADVVHYDREP